MRNALKLKIISRFYPFWCVLYFSLHMRISVDRRERPFTLESKSITSAAAAWERRYSFCLITFITTQRMLNNDSIVIGNRLKNYRSSASAMQFVERRAREKLMKSPWWWWTPRITVFELIFFLIIMHDDLQSRERWNVWDSSIVLISISLYS